MFNIGIDIIDELHDIYYEMAIINYIHNLIKFDINEKIIKMQDIETVRLELLELLLMEQNKSIVKLNKLLKRNELVIPSD